MEGLGKATCTVTGKSYATLIQEFFVAPPEGEEKVGLFYNQSLIYKVDLSLQESYNQIMN